MEREQEIRGLAYKIWEEEGCPHGRNVEHWLKAEAMLQSRNDGDEPEPKVRRPARKRVKRSRVAQATSQ
jgi:hypothetical protein